MHEIVLKAKEFATKAHAGQTRRYTGEPYIGHPARVAFLTASAIGDPEVIAAAYLHDVVEDTPTSLSDIERLFGKRVARLVFEVTDISRKEDGNRKTRKVLDLKHLAKASPEGQTIKLADLLDNTEGVMAHDPSFAAVYMREKAALLEVLLRGDIGLYEEAADVVSDYFSQHQGRF